MGRHSVWFRRMLDREARMVDMQIMASLQKWHGVLCIHQPVRDRRRTGAGALDQRRAGRLRDTPEAEAHVIRTSRLFEAAGRHFNRGRRAFFFALGYLGWFVSPRGSVRHHGAGRDRQPAQAVRIERLAGDGELARIRVATIKSAARLV